MAFRNLTEAECGQVNPLMKLTGHLTADQAFRETHGLQPFPSESDQLVEQFLQETRTVPQTFRMDDLLREMHEIESQRSALPPVPASRVKDQLNDDLWAQQFVDDGRQFNELIHEDTWSQAVEQENDLEDEDLGIGEDWAKEYVERELGEQTEMTDALEVQHTANELVSNVDDPTFAYSKFMKFMRQVGDGEVTITGGEVIGDTSALETADLEWSKEFVAAATPEGSSEVAKQWSEEFTAKVADKVTTDPNYNSQFWDHLQNEWQKLSEDTEQEHPWISEFSDYYDPYKEYTFNEDNPMSELPNPLEVGKQKLAEGDLPSAVLCFEAAIKQEAENVEAWQLLGTTQAENEQDPNAISALKRCLQLDPGNLTALMALAVSYTNENYYNQACQTLTLWLKANSKYNDLVPSNINVGEKVSTLMSESQHKQVQDLFIKAVHKNPQDIDYQIQCGLGVLFNLSGEYDKAIDCFRTALQVKPDDAQLWNRLGATLANGNRSEEAVEAYHNALQISPGFIRARYNVGITCINLGAYREAAEHFLTALNKQAQGRDVTDSSGSSPSQMSDTIWSTLRMCVSLMNRQDLKPHVESRDLSTLNQAFDM